MAWIILFFLVILVMRAGAARAQALDALDSWEGAIDYFATGAPLCTNISSPTNCDALNQPESVTVSTSDIPATATLVAAYLYWAGKVGDQGNCTSWVNTDDEVVLTLPGGTVGATIIADECFCNTGGASSYDMQACRVDITSLVVVSGMQGTYTVDELAIIAGGESTDNGSFSVVIVYEELTLPPRRVALFDGLEMFYTSSGVISLAGLDVDSPAEGDLTWYVIEGDTGTVGDTVAVTGSPGGLSVTLSDAINPANDVMNRTINTTTPAQTGVVGVDIDRLDISAGLTVGDTSVDMTYTATGDKYWTVFNVVGINVYKALIHPKLSHKNWVLHDDADSSGNVTPGDTIRYTITLVNGGSAPGDADVVDAIPAAAASWTLVDDAGGVNASTSASLIVTGITVPGYGTADVVLDIVLSPESAGTSFQNIAVYNGGDDDNSGELSSSTVTVYTGPGDPDAGVPDAAVVGPDAAVVGPDAAVETDSGTGLVVDAGGGGGANPVGCGCRTPVGGGSTGGLILGLVCLGWVWRRRRLQD